MIDRIDSLKSSVEESVTVEEQTPVLEDSEQAEHLLRMPGDEEPADGAAALNEKDLGVFCQTGLVPLPSVGRAGLKTGWIPAILHPFVGDRDFRRPWPLLMSQARSGFRIETLSDVVDALVELVEDSGDAGELEKRAIFRLEHRLRETSDREPIIDLHAWLDGPAPKLQERGDGRKDRMEADARAAEAIRTYADEGSRLIGYGEEGLRELMIAVSTGISDGRQRAFIEDCEWLATRLEDLLRMDEADSEQGHSPERLKHSVGGDYARTIDFSSLSHLLDEAPHGAALDEIRKRRIERTLQELSKFSATLFSEDRKTCFRSFEEAHRALESRVEAFTGLARARQIGRLEIENQYRADVHDALFDAFTCDAIPETDRKAFPPVLVHVHADETPEFGGLDLLLRTLGEAGLVRVLVTCSTLFDEPARPSTGLEVARLTMMRGDVFVQQSTAALADFVANGLQLSARSRGSSVLSIYTGADTTVPGLDAFMSAAIAADSRTVPAFRFDPENGAEWADRFSAGENEQPESTWASETIDVKSGESTVSRVFSTTPADALAFDLRFEKHFLAIAPSVQSPHLVELSEFFELEEASRAKSWPFIWVRGDEETLLRVVLAPAVVRTVDAVRTRWKMIQEWAGLDSSILKRGLEEAEEEARKRIDEALTSAQEEFDLRMNESIQSLAHKIVGNIAASMLGMESGAPSIPVAPVVAAPAVERAEPRDMAPPEETVSEAPKPEAAEEEDLGIALDEAYIETPRCTSCNECVDLNGLIFGYNEDKQAFIKDASAGPYRDLVLAAEKCPVSIIHPGKPLDESEKHLDEWIERAKPYL